MRQDISSEWRSRFAYSHRLAQQTLYYIALREPCRSAATQHHRARPDLFRNQPSWRLKLHPCSILKALTGMFRHGKTRFRVRPAVDCRWLFPGVKNKKNQTCMMNVQRKNL